MTQLIGVVLIVYGIVGLLGTILLYWWLTKPQGPIARFRQRLLSLSGQLHEGSTSAQQALRLARDVRALFQSVTAKVHDVTDHLRLLVQIVNQLAVKFGEFLPLTDAFKVKAPGAPATVTIPQTGFSVPVVTGVRLSHTSIPTGPGHSVEVATPPLEVEMGSVGFSLGPFTVVSGLNFTDVYPLQSFGQVYAAASQTVAQVGAKIDELADDIDRVGELPGDTRASLDQLINNVLTPLPGTLEQASTEARQAANSSWLDLGPLLGLGYLALMHVAFALTGVALLFA
jgi:hypothetical protein